MMKLAICLELPERVLHTRDELRLNVQGMVCGEIADRHMDLWTETML